MRSNFITSMLQSARAFATYDTGKVDSVSLLVGSGRSGTSWLGRLLASDSERREIFEPFDPRRIKKIAPFKRKEYLHYLDNRPDVENVFLNVFSGKVKTKWTDGQSRIGVFDSRIIKEVRICLAIGWVAENFPNVPITYLIRNPFANAISRMKLGWDSDFWTANSEHVYTRYPNLDRKFESLNYDLAKHVWSWAADNAIGLGELSKSSAEFVFYEDLISHDGQQLRELRGKYCDNCKDLPSNLKPRESNYIDHRVIALKKYGTDAVNESDMVLRLFGVEGLYSPYPDHSSLEACIGANRGVGTVLTG